MQARNHIVIRGEERGWHQREAASRKLDVALEVADIRSPGDLDDFLHDGRQAGRSHLDRRPTCSRIDCRIDDQVSSAYDLQLFELTIDVKTATALGLTIPQSLLLRVEEVIQ